MKEKVREIAIAMAKEKGLANLTRVDVSKEAGIKEGSWFSIMECNFTDFLESIKDECPMRVVGFEISKSRISPKVRKELILDTALDLSEKVGYTNVNRAELAKAARVSESLVSTYMGTMKNLRRDIMRHAIKQSRLVVLAQGLALKDPHALKAPEELQEQARQSL